MGKKKKNDTKFNVLEYNFTTKKVDYYDVLPYFRRCWEDRKFNFDKKDVKSKDDLKNWIKRASQYQYWARCEYEFLMAPWPFGSYQFKQDMSELLKQGVNLDNIDENIKFSNTITREMYKIDVHEQIMMNIKVVTDILYEEFKKNIENNGYRNF